MKRSYFGRDNDERMLLGGGVEAMKGVYQSIRCAEVLSFVGSAFTVGSLICL